MRYVIGLHPTLAEPVRTSFTLPKNEFQKKLGPKNLILEFFQYPT